MLRQNYKKKIKSNLLFKTSERKIRNYYVLYSDQNNNYKGYEVNQNNKNHVIIKSLNNKAWIVHIGRSSHIKIVENVITKIKSNGKSGITIPNGNKIVSNESNNTTIKKKNLIRLNSPHNA